LAYEKVVLGRKAKMLKPKNPIMLIIKEKINPFFIC